MSSRQPRAPSPRRQNTAGAGLKTTLRRRQPFSASATASVIAAGCKLPQASHAPALWQRSRRHLCGLSCGAGGGARRGRGCVGPQLCARRVDVGVKLGVARALGRRVKPSRDPPARCRRAFGGALPAALPAVHQQHGDGAVQVVHEPRVARELGARPKRQQPLQQREARAHAEVGHAGDDPGKVCSARCVQLRLKASLQALHPARIRLGPQGLNAGSQLCQGSRRLVRARKRLLAARQQRRH
ncbi:MAG: hypothetical protein J3K34DRAFT_429892 [Monoraphidium minutum]|nr:MAG: hypothetical protein J3K34DRAFT_429892 [Monoraphidium minutum]